MRIGDNPQRHKKVNLGDYFHQVIMPVYIPNLDGYYKDSFDVFKYSLQSLIKTSHNKTYISVISNGSCDEVNTYINELYAQNKIHEFILTKTIGKLNAILKGLSGINLPLVTITDADVLFLNNWQRATYDVFEHFPKAGSVSPVPTPFLTFHGTSNIFRQKLFSKQIKYSKIKNLDALHKFAKSIDSLQLITDKYLTISNQEFKAVIGCGHFIATYKTQIFDFNFKRSTEFLLGGKSENLMLDSKAFQNDLWNLSTEDNYAYHLGNTVPDWVEEVISNLSEEDNNSELPEDIKVVPLGSFRKRWIRIGNKVFGSYKFQKLVLKRLLK